MPEIQLGVHREEVVLVEDHNAITFLGHAGARVLSTPHMIGYMERTSRNLVLPMLETGFDTVGTIVNVAHVGAAPIGSEVTFRSEIENVENRRVNFRVSAFNQHGKIGEGTHQRFIIHVERFAQKLRAKG
jgi:fluoroacetyl-CoA thioesterase